MSEFTISQDQLDALAAKLLEAWVKGDVPYEVQGAINKAVCARLLESGEWTKLADAIAADFEARRQEVAEKIVTGMIDQLACGIGDASRQVLSKLSERLGKVQVY